MNVEIREVSHAYANHPPQPVLERLETFIPAGQFTAIIGPSGCGKSTLLRLIAALITPTQGQIRVDGKTTQEARAAQRTAWMAQSPALLPWLTARENVLLASRLLAKSGHRQLDPQEALRRVGLAGVDGAYPLTLSGGMQQRLALARLLVQNAGLWLMDEPFAALDEITRENLALELLELWQPAQATVLWVTHNIYEALRLADRVLVFSSAPGRIVADVAINLPRPRTESSPGFQGHLAGLRAALAAGSQPKGAA